MSRDRSHNSPDGLSPAAENLTHDRGQSSGPAIGPLDEVIANLDLEVAPPPSVAGNAEGSAGEANEDIVVMFEETPSVAAEQPRAAREERPAPPPIVLDDVVSREHYLRLHADFENLRKRLERERDDLYLHATSSLTARLLPVLDNFERAISAGRQPGGVAALLEGVELVHRQFIDELRQEGLRDIDAMGLAFDPEVHEAVASDSASSAPPNSVVAVMRRGYFFHDRVLRPALVCVSTEPDPPIERDDRRED